MKLLEERIRQEGIVKSEASSRWTVSSIIRWMRLVLCTRWARNSSAFMPTRPSTRSSPSRPAASVSPSLPVCTSVCRSSLPKRAVPPISGTMVSITLCVHSYTHNNDNNVIVSREYLSPEDHLLIIDDFLANGCAMEGLIDLAHQAERDRRRCRASLWKRASRRAATSSVRRATG